MNQHLPPPDMATLDFEMLVDQFYQPLFRFALSLSRREAEAYDLTQQTFVRWATKGHQLRDKSKVKTWLFTTLHREFLAVRRKNQRLVEREAEDLERELPVVEPEVVQAMDGEAVLQCLMQVDELFRAPLMLFYLEQHSYQEIADTLEIPIGTVMSRLSRGKKLLREILLTARSEEVGKVVAFDPQTGRKSNGHS